MADKKISEFPIFDGVQDAQTYYILASGEAGDPDADNYKMPFTNLTKDITAGIDLYSGLSGVFDHLTSGASGVFTNLVSGATGSFTEELLLAGKPIVTENADGGIDLGSTEPPPAGTDAPPVNLLHGGEQKISMDDDIIVIGGVNNDPTDKVEIINPTEIKETLTVADGKDTTLGGNTTIKETLTVADGKDTTLGGNTTIKGTTNLNSSLTVADGQDTTLGGATTIKGATTFNSTANFTDSTKITFGSATPAQTLQDIIDAGGKWSEGASAGDIVYNGGNVGIGTTNPGAKFHVSGANDTTFVNSNVTMLITGTDEFDSGNAGSGIGFVGKHNDNGLVTTFGQIYTKKENNTSGDYDASLCFGTRKTGKDSNTDLEKMRITSDGNVGIGTPIPSANLHVLKDMGNINVDNSFTLQKTAYTRSDSHPEGSGKIMTHKLHELNYSGNFSTVGNNHANDKVIGLDVSLNTNAGYQYAALFNGGNVGIGTSNPARLLHLKNNNSAIAFETPIDSNGSAFAQIKSARDGNSGFSSTLEFATTESATAVPTFGGNGTGGSGFVTRMLIDSAGNVGIGTTDPDLKLDIVAANNNQLRIDSSDTNDTTFILDYNGTGSTDRVRISNSAGDLKFSIANDYEAMRIDSDGNVGIGTSPTKPLEVAQANGNSGLRLNYLPDQYKNRHNADLYYDGVGALKIESWSDSATTAGDIVLGNNGGNVGIGTSSPSSPLTIGSNNTANYPYMAFENSSTDSKNGTNLGAIFFKGRQPDDSLETGAAIRAKGNGDAANDSNNLPGQLLFQTNPGGTGGLENRMLIDKNGNVGIGTVGPSAKLNVENGHILVNQSVNTTQENILLQGSGYKLSNGTMYGNVSIRSNYDAFTNAATLNFYTAASSTSTAERMRIKSDGSVEINNRLGVGIDPVEKLDINGTAMFRDTAAPTQTANRLYSVSGKLYWNGSELASGSSSNFAAANHTHTLSDITDLTLVSENAANTKLFLGGNTSGNTAAKNVVNGGLESVGANVQITVNNANLNPGFRLRNEQTSSTAHEEIDLQLVKNGDFVITAPKKSTGNTDLLRIANDGKIVISITPPAFDNNLGANTIFHENGFLRIKGVNDSASLGGSSNVDAINDLSDVSIANTLASGDILYYNGSNWTGTGGSLKYIAPTATNDGQLYTPTLAIQKQVSTLPNSPEGAEIAMELAPSSTLTGGYLRIDVHEDKIRFFEAGQTSQKMAFIDLASCGNAAASNQHQIITAKITSLAANDILYYNGTQWVNDAPTEPAFISDKKYKTEIFPISEALSKVNSIKGANFTWSDDAPSDLGGKKDVGVIAQDIQKVLPEAVEEKENGDLTVKYHRIIPLLIESIKELSEENKTLKSRLDKIEGTS